MENLITEDRLVLFLIFVVPGFVAMKTHDLLIPTEARDWGSCLVEATAYSMLNVAALFWLVGLLQNEGSQEQHPVIHGIGMFGVLFVAPVGWAFLARYVMTSRLLRRLVLDPAPTAWDFFFAQRHPAWVLFHLKTGQKLGGLFWLNSTASAFPSPADIYVEEVWRLDDHGRFIERIDQTAGALVKREDCSLIELFRIEHEE